MSATSAASEHSLPLPYSGDDLPPEQLLVGLTARGLRPAALIGEWFGHRAIVAVNVDMSRCAPDALFSTSADQPWFFGTRPYSGPSFGGVVSAVAVLDDGGSWRISGTDAVAAQSVHDEVLECIGDHVASVNCESKQQQRTAPLITWREPNRPVHQLAVEDCKEAIRDGEVYQACISTRFYGTVVPTDERTDNPSRPIEVAAKWFADKVRSFQPKRAAFLPGSTTDATLPIVASLSPEEFLIRTGDHVRETPIKGTRPDSARPEDLLASSKDVAENIMIVDLVRHDLGQVARTGKVWVSDLLSVRRAPGVWHLFSTVEAELEEGISHGALVEACFPPASVTGTPKLRAQELISQWEPVERGVHCGCIGAACGEDLELNVAIRTAEFFAETNTDSPQIRAEAGIGGGITIGSDAADEWNEVLAKARPLLEC